MTISIVCENQSAILADSDLDRYMAAWTIQLNQHLAAFWPAVDHYYSLYRGIAAGSGQRAMIFQDGIPVKSDLGYHDVESGQVTMRIDCAAARDDGYQVSEIGSHELCEQAVDAQCQTYSDGAWGRALVEVCDMFIMPGMTYNINGVEVANFTTPSFWHLGPAARLDMKGQLTAPFPTVPQGAYTMIIPPGLNAWKMTFATAPEMPPALRTLMLSRAGRSARVQHVINREARHPVDHDYRG